MLLSPLLELLLSDPAVLVAVGIEIEVVVDLVESVLLFGHRELL